MNYGNFYIHRKVENTLFEIRKGVEVGCYTHEADYRNAIKREMRKNLDKKLKSEEISKEIYDQVSKKLSSL